MGTEDPVVGATPGPAEDRNDRDGPDRFRVSMTLPGSASLGAFQAGAVSALAEAFHELRRQGIDIALDAVGGASAGSIVGMLFAHGLATGRDVTRLMRDAWIDKIDVTLLREGDSSAPLGFDNLRRDLTAFLQDTDEHPLGVHEPLESTVGVHISLTSLLGFEAPIETAADRAEHDDDPAGRSATSTLSYVDWMSFELQPGHDVAELSRPEGRSLIDAALVSAAHPMAFSPRSLDRSDDRQDYERRGITNFPPGGRLWYTDGGLVESKPVGTVVREARERAGDATGRRMHFVVDPRSSGPSSGQDWGRSDGDHAWIDGLRRSLSIVPTQSLHDDLRAIATVNERLQAIDDLVAKLTGVDPAGAPDEQDEQRVRRLRGDILEAVGLAGKEQVELQMISPLLVAEEDDDSVSDLLAGDFVGAFGGFLDKDVRRSDFLLGWRATSRWAEDGLQKLGVDQPIVTAVLHRLNAQQPDFGRSDPDTDGVDQLDWRGRWQLARVAGRAGRILVGEALGTRSLPKAISRWRSQR